MVYLPPCKKTQNIGSPRFDSLKRSQNQNEEESEKLKVLLRIGGNLVTPPPEPAKEKTDEEELEEEALAEMTYLSSHCQG